MIPVTKPFLPPQEKYISYIKGIWERNWLTNHGPLVNQLELELKDYLGIEHLLFLANGTLALQIAIKALKLKGEVVTTPFSYVATTNSIIWENCKPVFVDIDPYSLNICPQKIEDAITPETTGILATHVYGNPCEIETIQQLATKNNLKLIFDAAHCFGVKYKGRSVFEYGDISTASFHATKLFHTIEGGAVITKDPLILQKMAYLRNFGHEGRYDFKEPGINAKNSEFHAAMGLSVLPHMSTILEKRKILSKHYDFKLKNLSVRKPKITPETDYNYAYYPIIFKEEKLLEKSLENLSRYNIACRRYFFPSLNRLSYLSKKVSLQESDSISKRVLCLPLYHTLTIEEIDMISRILLRAQRYV